MKKLMGAAMLAGATIAGAGAANADVSATVTFTTDYVFRGISQTDGGAAIQGSFDWSQDIFYAGVWGSNVNFGAAGPTDLASMELDGYVGITPTTGPVSWDIGFVGYFYPNGDDSLAGGEMDYYEGIVQATMDLTEHFGVGATFGYTPDYFGETGNGTYWELNGTYTIDDATSITAAYGVEDVDFASDSYSTWNIGFNHTMHGFNVGLMYTDTEDAFDNGYVLDPTNADGRVILSIGRTL